MDGGYLLEDDATNASAGKCGTCRQMGHDRRHCPQAQVRPQTTNEADANLQADADEMDVLDSKLLIDPEEEFFSAEEGSGSDSSMFGLI